MFRAMYAFDHCVKTAAPAVGAGNNNPAVGFGYPNATLLLPTSMAVDNAGFLCGYGNSANVNVGFDMTGIVPPNPTKVTFGFRVKTINVYGSSHAMISFAPVATPNDTSNYMVLLGNSGSPWLPTLNNEAYIELTYDFVAFTASMQVNGNPVTIVQGPAPTAAMKSAFVSGSWCFNLVLTNTLNARYGYRDIYVLDAVAGEGGVAPLGPQRHFPVQLDTADGVGWNPSVNGTPLLDVLNAALPANPYITSPTDRTPLVASLKTTAPAGSRISAVSLSLSGTSIGDVAAINKVEVSQGGTTLAAKFVPVAKTITYGAPIGVYLKAPDGGAWDLAKLDATTVKLTPDTAV